MNFNEACIILELPNSFNSQELKHNYYSLALKYHPDKNFEIDATSKFQTIQSAYNYLNNLNNLNNEKNNTKIYNEKIISLLTLKCNELTFAFLKSLPQNSILELHSIIVKYSKILNISPDILDKINIIKDSFNLKNNNNTCEETKILKPSLNNLLNADLYKYTHCNEDLYIPYWHHELVYDLSQCTIIFKCEPELPEFITIDEFNNLYITITINIFDIINLKNIDINIGEKMYIIPVNELKIIKQQTYIIKKQGIPLINMKNIYNITLKADIHFNIIFNDLN